MDQQRENRSTRSNSCGAKPKRRSLWRKIRPKAWDAPNRRRGHCPRDGADLLRRPHTNAACSPCGPKKAYRRHRRTTPKPRTRARGVRSARRRHRRGIAFMDSTRAFTAMKRESIRSTEARRLGRSLAAESATPPHPTQEEQPPAGPVPLRRDERWPGEGGAGPRRVPLSTGKIRDLPNLQPRRA